MENRNYCVYCHTNKQNGKKYIGITGQKPEKRWRNGLGYKTQQRFWNAIQLHGWHAFTHEILYTDLTKEEAEELEIQLIAKYETQNPMKGYNIAAGGNATTGFLGHRHTEESRKKMSESHKRIAKSEKWKEQFMEKEKVIGRLKGKGCLPVQCIETGVIYYCMQKAGEFAGVCSDSIKNCCNGVSKTAGGFHWQRVTWEEYETQEATKNAKGGEA